MSAKGVRAGRAFVELGTDDRIAAGLRRAQRQLQSFAAGVRALGTGLLAVGGAASAAIGGMALLFARTGDDLRKMSERTAFSVEFLHALGFAAEQSGGNIRDLGTAVRMMNKTMLDAERGSSTAIDALDRLGITLAQLQALDPEQRFLLMFKALARVGDEGLRSALAMEVFGRAGMGLLPLLRAGPEGITRLIREAHALGIVMSQEDAESAVELTDALARLRKQLAMVSMQIGAAVAPALVRFQKRVSPVIRGVIGLVREHRPLVVMLAKVSLGVAVAGGALLGLGVAVGGVAFVLGKLAVAVTFAGAVIGAILSPLGLVTVALAGSAAAFVKWTDAGSNAVQWLQGRFWSLLDSVSAVVRAIIDAILAGDFGLAFEIVWIGAKVAFLNFAAWLEQMWSELVNSVFKALDSHLRLLALAFPKIRAEVNALRRALRGVEIGADTAGVRNILEALRDVRRRQLDSLIRSIPSLPDHEAAPRFPGELGAAVSAAMNRITVAGTFNPFAARGLQGTGPLAQAANAAQRAADELEDLGEGVSSIGRKLDLIAPLSFA